MCCNFCFWAITMLPYDVSPLFHSICVPCFRFLHFPSFVLLVWMCLTKNISRIRSCYLLKGITAERFWAQPACIHLDSVYWTAIWWEAPVRTNSMYLSIEMAMGMMRFAVFVWLNLWICASATADINVLDRTKKPLLPKMCLAAHFTPKSKLLCNLRKLIPISAQTKVEANEGNE